MLLHGSRRSLSSIWLNIFSSLRLSTSAAANPDQSHPRKGRQAIRRILKLLSTVKSSHLYEALQSLESSPQSLSSSEASILVDAISNPLISFDFYRFLRSCRSTFKPEPILFSSLIKSQLLSINPQLFKIQYYFDEMKKHKVSLSPNDFCSFFGIVLPNYVATAEFFVRGLLEEIEFDEGAYCYAISVYAQHGLYKEAILVAERARVRGSNPSLAFYSCLMDVYSKNVDARAAMKLFLEMEDAGVLADEGIYRTLLGVLCRVGWVKLCGVILEEMRKVGYRPDKCLAMDLIGRFVEEDIVSEAVSLFEEGILKDNHSLATFVKAMVEKRRHGVAFELVKKVQHSGFDVNGHVYASLIRGCGKIGLVDEAEKIFAEIKSSEGIKNRKLVYSSMINVYSRAEMKASAEMVWNEMESLMGSRVSEEALLSMMSLYGALGLVDDTVRVFNWWKNSGCCLNIDAYVVLVNALVKSGKLNQAKDCLLEMRMSSIHPTIQIYSAMMEGYLQVGLLNHALMVFDEYKISGLEADEVVANLILRILIQANRFSELKFYLDRFLRQAIRISRDKGTPLLEICRDDLCFRKLSHLIQ
ncbi:pentatricopeptide repeat-containing protein At5g46580, chloroplastic-like [Macadamia integrifolia]|uniref:pentatricopeptide repeat-containing protein At5g46580, chloroplastic-like n=1 Tax=Macadamia integrifolia TaxID=60698 RepID=UPI001C52F22D|nr:pentatricopeptide repeat-containing protein At5g46580, chloroplastic-like [Macadamia integrifolia]